jgi:hypothetical protein
LKSRAPPVLSPGESAGTRSKGMAAEKFDLRDVSFRQLLPWTEIFRGFQVALDPKKLLLAAAGLLVMTWGWWVLSIAFFNSRERPDWNSGKYSTGEGDKEAAWQRFKLDLHKWDILYQAAGPGPRRLTAYDLAERQDQVDVLTKELTEAEKSGRMQITFDGRTYFLERPGGLLRTWPWDEDRGPNPYLLVTGQVTFSHADSTTTAYPWERGHFFDWLINHQIPVLIEPFIKFLLPIRFLLKPHAGFWNDVYFVLILLWTVATWALFGGAITRMAAVQIARKEKISMMEALRFTGSRYVSFFAAPLFPLVFVVVIVVFLIIFGLFHLIPLFGDIVVDGLGWPLILLCGLAMAVVMVGLVGWPMMYATISTEGSDSFDALSRSYSYVYVNPWQYLWYQLVAFIYGAIVVFFVGFMGSLLVYLGKWGVDQTPFLSMTGRQPEYLFVYAPTSYHWRELLMQGATVGRMTWYNHLGAIMVSIWLYLVFLMVVGFAYSFYWSVNTIIYLLMRRIVDDTEIDEIYLEDEEADEPYPMPSATPTLQTEPGTVMVEAPTLKQAAPAPSPPGDGNPPTSPPA